MLKNLDGVKINISLYIEPLLISYKWLIYIVFHNVHQLTNIVCLSLVKTRLQKFINLLDVLKIVEMIQTVNPINNQDMYQLKMMLALNIVKSVQKTVLYVMKKNVYNVILLTGHLQISMQLIIHV